MNKKVKNATSKIYNNIKFKSLAEMNCYIKLVEAGFNPSYETHKEVLSEGFYPSHSLVYIPNKVKTPLGNMRYDRELSIQNKKIRDITYTTDFTLELNDNIIYIEVKGFENDTYPLKKKLFIKNLENKNDGKVHIFFEIHTTQHVKHMIEILNKL